MSGTATVVLAGVAIYAAADIATGLASSYVACRGYWASRCL